jgi:hypothetical protein
VRVQRYHLDRPQFRDVSMQLLPLSVLVQSPLVLDETVLSSVLQVVLARAGSWRNKRREPMSSAATERAVIYAPSRARRLAIITVDK